MDASSAVATAGSRSVRGWTITTALSVPQSLSLAHAVAAVEAEHQRPRQLVLAGLAQLLAAAADEPLEALERARIVRLAGRHPLEDPAHLAEQRLALRPGPGGDQHLGRVAVARGVVGDHRRQVLRHEVELALA